MNRTILKYLVIIGVIMAITIIVSILLISKKPRLTEPQQRWFFSLEAENEIFRAPVGNQLGEVNKESCNMIGGDRSSYDRDLNYYVNLKEKALYVLELDNFRMQKFTYSGVEVIDLPPELHYKERLLAAMQKSLGEYGGATKSSIKKTEKSKDIPGFRYCARGPLDEPDRVYFRLGGDGFLYLITEDYYGHLFVYRLDKTTNKFIPIIIGQDIEVSIGTLLIDHKGIIWLLTHKDGHGIEIRVDSNGKIISEAPVDGVLEAVDEADNIYRREVAYEKDGKYKRTYLAIYNKQGEIIKKINYDLKDQLFPEVFNSKTPLPTQADYDKESNSWVVRKKY